jgi:hypothetical protein
MSDGTDVMAMTALVVALLAQSASVEIDLSGLFRRAFGAPKVTCDIRIVGYRFIGKEGQTFRYAGDEYVVPADGYVELIAHPRRTSYSVGGKSIQIEPDPPLDPFGFRDVFLQPGPISKGESK